ncbi:hypothetical protein HBI56_076990 [Parastagonospora nodorum]|uniref:Uncharacterized protein n=1 Tax=Phaeosphaeria nodorum (strain SN15 / ATCC MYA-4574 / FGSC 10173) TaxID=321614 RepID=A0A7U2EWI6_PHANO|nr:hypothetical protein HBH56_150190 [Parastagonospora nodorum]QRC94247.1 hypothetical protein JI435_405460 [Parastagonospora nodorum SN15]KAH3928474.1 hypothetical protein HBH54_136090 [Parastagonospora nodorum]KAH3984005.1 hypothetical protein HBH52_062340 [Parastagonospora nodorum]KAH3985943.1 hypothetical protein HBH51_021130 [Parastagonospora nodorum]
MNLSAMPSDAISRTPTYPLIGLVSPMQYLCRRHCFICLTCFSLELPSSSRLVTTPCDAGRQSSTTS